MPHIGGEIFKQFVRVTWLKCTVDMDLNWGSDNFKKRTIKEKYHYEIRYNEKTGKPYKNKVKIIDAYAGVEWFFGDWISLDYLFDDYICENRYGKKYFPPQI